MSHNHAGRRRPRLSATPATAFAAVATTALLVQAGGPAIAAPNAPDSPSTDVQTSTATTTSIRSEAARSLFGPPSFARTVRAIERERRLLRQAERQARQEARELRQERRERARERAARAAARAFGQWVSPISGATMSAYFGQSGSAWSSGYHTGQDWTAPYGTPVVAASGGTITFAGWSDAYGNKIEITHPDGNQTWYAHMSSFERTSGTVGPGQVIGYVGCTGNCSGNHLHFEFHPGGGTASDPVAWLTRHGAF